MFCSKCGLDNDDRAPLCAHCGSPLTGQAPAWSGAPATPKPDNYLVWSILATLFCCLIPGIVGIVYAAQVDSKYSAGDYAGAQSAAASAKTWTLVAFGLGLAAGAVYAVMAVIGMAARGGRAF
jgi:hypothetical protein